MTAREASKAQIDALTDDAINDENLVKKERLLCESQMHCTN